ncbi:MAG: glucose-6-phosphate dehydrogenase [Terriglobia bacterium]
MTTQSEAPLSSLPPGGGVRPGPCAIVVFGASGDLTARKLIPALYDLCQAGRLPESFYIVGLARREWSSDKFRQQMRTAVDQHARFPPTQAAAWDKFAARLHYQCLDANNADSYQRLRARLEELDPTWGTPGNYVFYLAVAPHLYPIIVEHLGRAGLAATGAPQRGWRRIVIEKPFGHDRASARRLNLQVRAVFQEEQVYRIDHYLGKETVQNLMVFRFANGIFEPIWNRNFIDHVQISVVEELGVEERAGYYEQAGAVRDMIQNHLLQLLCLVAMEPPASFEATPVRQEKLKVLRALRPLLASQVDQFAVRGQYGPGQLNAAAVPGYRQEKGVKPDSATETFAAVKFQIENWRWAGVPFWVRTGKRLPKKSSVIAVQFRDAPLHLFACTPMGPCEPNRLTVRLQPNEGIGLRFIAKEPGLQVVGRPVEMDFGYGAAFPGESPSAYETLLLDCLEGDPMLFARGDWVENAWELLTPLLEAWAAKPPADFPNYAAGTWGPRQADALLERDARHWHIE